VFSHVQKLFNFDIIHIIFGSNNKAIPLRSNQTKLTAQETAATTTIQVTAPRGPYDMGSMLPLAAPFDGEALAAALDDAEAGALPELEVKAPSVVSAVFEIVTPVEFVQKVSPLLGPVPLTKLTAAHCTSLAITPSEDLLFLYLNLPDTKVHQGHWQPIGSDLAGPSSFEEQ
jgi:hypothetical protein